MPKIFGKEVHPMLLLGAAGVALYLVMGALQGPEPIAQKPKKPPVAAKKTTDVDYTKEDYTAQFASLPHASPKDAFRPLIMKSTSGPGANPSIDNFTYSGMALLNNEPNGLLENSTTGEGDFVKPGQRWHQQWLVVSVSPEQIDLRNDVGEDTVLKVGSSTSGSSNSSAAPAAAGPTPNGPFNPAAMTGPIGAQDLSIQPDPTGATMMGGGNGRTRGGGRGRNGGGRRGGGNGIGGTTDGN